MYQSVTPLTNAYQQQASQFGPSVDAIANQLRRPQPKGNPAVMDFMNRQMMAAQDQMPPQQRPYQTDPMEMGLANAQNALGQQEMQPAFQQASAAAANPAQDVAMQSMYTQRPPQDPTARVAAQSRISPQVQAIMNARKQPQGMARQAPPQQITPIQNTQY